MQNVVLILLATFFVPFNIIVTMFLIDFQRSIMKKEDMGYGQAGEGFIFLLPFFFFIIQFYFFLFLFKEKYRKTLAKESKVKIVFYYLGCITYIINIYYFVIAYFDSWKEWVIDFF